MAHFGICSSFPIVVRYVHNAMCLAIDDTETTLGDLVDYRLSSVLTLLTLTELYQSGGIMCGKLSSIRDAWLLHVVSDTTVPAIRAC